MGEMLAKLSDELAAAVQAAGNVVVRVAGRQRLAASGFVWSSEGVVVTANHVVRRDEGVKVTLPGGESLPARLAGRDPGSDLAVLRVAASGLQAATVEPAGELAVGHLVLALGRPGARVQATLGIVSALGDTPWQTPAGGQIDRYLQTDAVMYPGFSGGPLVDVGGRVLGLNTSAILNGISLALPTKTIDRVVSTLLAHGRIRRGYLGVNTQPVRLPPTSAGVLQQDSGLLVVAVEPESPAEQSGLLLGDTLVSFAGRPVREHDDLLALLAGDCVGLELPVRVLRGGEVMSVNVTVGER